jgi:hypothetical protein
VRLTLRELAADKKNCGIRPLTSYTAVFPSARREKPLKVLRLSRADFQGSGWFLAFPLMKIKFAHRKIKFPQSKFEFAQRKIQFAQRKIGFAHRKIRSPP